MPGFGSVRIDFSILRKKKIHPNVTNLSGKVYSLYKSGNKQTGDPK